jgi:malate dehydrogenase (oxaloacetate-decarboxylating)
MSQEAINYHRENKGKIQVTPKKPLASKEELSLAYTPGVAQVSQAIAEDPKQSWELTNRSNSVAIVSDGTAVLGLGNIGPEAGMPVMEGKSMIFKEMAGIDAYPLCINAGGVEDIVRFCKMIEPSFGGINLEDIAAPTCFQALSRLEKELTIPVFHDDQDGTAIVVLAALINASKLRGQKIENSKIVINGAGAAGIAISKLLLHYGAKEIVLLDSQGAVYKSREDLNPAKQEIANKTNIKEKRGKLEQVIVDMDIFIGVSLGNIVTLEMIKSMRTDPIVLAMANPAPEIYPEEAHKGGAYIVGTGRSDYPNQINNALVFPGIFRGLLDMRSGQEKCPMPDADLKIKVARAIAEVITPKENKILPEVMDKRVVRAIKEAIKR